MRYLDPHHQHLASRGIHLLKEVGALQGYNDWRKKKIKEPRITSSRLDQHIQSFSRNLSTLWLTKSEYAEFLSLTEGITKAMHIYEEYLDQKNENMKDAHRQTEVGAVNESKVSQLITKLNDEHKLYSTREMRKDFLHQYHTLTKVDQQECTKECVQNIDG